MLAAWYFDMIAIYYMRFPMFPVAFGFNVSLGAAIFALHTLQDQKVNEIEFVELVELKF